MTPGGAAPAEGRADGAFVAVAEWDDDARLEAEKETLGLYLTGHPFDRWRQELDLLTGGPLEALAAGRRVVAGLLVGLRVVQSRRGRMAVATLDDGTGRVECTLYSEVFSEAADRLVKDRVLVIDGQVAVDDFTGGPAVTAERVFDLDAARATFGRQLAIDTELCSSDRRAARALHEAVSAHLPGRCPVLVRCRDGDAVACYRLGDRWRVRPTEDLLARLRAITGVTRAEVEYPAATPAQAN
jgi:DNA polymerase-3 subunit alpha